MNVPASLLLLGLGCFPGAAPDDTSAKALKSLQGFWLFEKGERNDAGLWSLPEEGIYIEGNLLRHVKKSGELIFNGSAAEITVDASKTPFKNDLVRKNGKPGQKVLGILKSKGTSSSLPRIPNPRIPDPASSPPNCPQVQPERLTSRPTNWSNPRSPRNPPPT